MRWQMTAYNIKGDERALRSAISDETEAAALGWAARYIEGHRLAGWTVELFEPGVVRLERGSERREVVVEQKEA